ncbi:MAG: hypothetical protein K9L17_00750 [Clostridiales bacterium]|nr:hypothetical protein [Clostridiales bacterium]MCF8021221.1 hypothetical protein [Clostridiales bacterium]
MSSSWIGILYVGGMLFFWGLVIVLIITVIRFIRQKNIRDKEILYKLDELISLHKEKDLPPKGN